MAEDRPEREDNRSYCDIHGHDYKKISSTTSRWEETESGYLRDEISFGAGFHGHSGGISQFRTRRIPHAIDTVIYECSICQEKITREENER